MNSRALTRTEVPIYQGQKILPYLFANSLYLGWFRSKFNFNAVMECSDLGGAQLRLYVTVITALIAKYLIGLIRINYASEVLLNDK